MKYLDPKLSHFSLRGRSILELRELARQHLQRADSEIAGLTKSELVSELSEAAAHSSELAKDLRRHGISLKPSFYLMRFSQNPRLSLVAARSRLQKYLKKHSAGLRELQVQMLEEPMANMFQVFLTWHSSYHYWSPDFELKQISQLEFGLVILDHNVGKAIVCCHSLTEREEICSLIGKALEIRFSSLVLTKPLLDQIGTFDTVKRAAHVISKPDVMTPMNITHADEKLATRNLARAEEENPRSQRQQTFYRIPITNPLLEEGIGATSDTGKLWIPKEIPLDSVRDYCISLLGKISGTLDEMTRNDEIENVLSTFKFDEMPDLAGADPLSFRGRIVELLRILIIMLNRKEDERSYTLPIEIAQYGAPLFFFYPALRLTDPDSGDAAPWSDRQYKSPQVRISGSLEHPVVKSFPGNEVIDLTDVEHPITGARVNVADVLGSIDLLPNEQFLKLAQDAVRSVAQQVPILKSVSTISFKISGHRIVLDIRRAFGDVASPVLMMPTDIVELSAPLQKHAVSSAKRSAVLTKLTILGEKCKHMSDVNCQSCLKDRQWLCLRSLLGRYLKNTEILAHKGIELCDMTCSGTVGSQQRRMWGFAKLATGKKGMGLTLRNKSGAVLLAQVFGQIDRTTFRTVLIISPDIINQDFQERAEVLCGAFGKEICFLNADDLARILLDFEEQAAFDGLDVEDIYKRSRTAKRDRKRNPA
jgi:hypothetical protein